jgi:photosystem II stability/assembly factor-like uncharacterized protein
VGDGASGRAPEPTEIARREKDEERLREERRAWYESLHRAPPWVDWRAVEVENRRRLVLERMAALEAGLRTDRWTELGSVNQAGRTHTACPSPDGTQLYVGSNLGGLWRGNIDGTGWVPISDGLGVGIQHALVVPSGPEPGAPEVILAAGTPGPGSANNEGFLYASTNGGTTWWVPQGLPEDLYECVRLVRDPSQPWVVYLLTRARRWTGPNTYEYGFMLCRSSDGGQSFETRYVFPANPRADLWMDRVQGGPLYVLSGTTLYASSDEGQSFQPVGELPVTYAMDVILAGSEAGSPTFYSALKTTEGWKLYRSTDGGVQWSWRYDITDFWETLEASISDPDLVFFAGVECWRSTDGGASFAKINDWWAYYGDPAHQLHADLPGMNVWIVGGTEAIYFNTDGGTFVSYDGGQTVQNLSLWGLAVSQYYSTFTSRNDPYLVVAGSQDQGYQRSQPGLRGAFLPFDQLISGDYGHLTSTERDHNWLYSVYPGFVLLQVSEDYPQFLYDYDFPPTQHSWMPFILADPQNPEAFYFCGDHLWRYERNAPGMTYTMTELPQDFGGEGGYLTALAISPADPLYWYAVTNQGRIWYSHDGGESWTASEHVSQAQYFYGTALVASANDRDLAYVGGSGYLGHPVWRTTDGGQSWEGLGDGLPNTLVLGLALGGASGEILFAATEAGPYAWDPATGQWSSLLGTEAPVTTYWSVEWVPELGVARFGTYGRGIWDYQPPASSSSPSPWVVASGPRLQLGPNPATDVLHLTLEAPRAGRWSVELFDSRGRCVQRLGSVRLEAGLQRVALRLQRRGLPAGTYFLMVRGEQGRAVRKFTYLP